MKRVEFGGENLQATLEEGVWIVEVDDADEGDGGEDFCKLAACPCGFFESFCDVADVETLAELLNKV